ncbi:hypothetical protein [Marinomonas epiphytica]
MDEQLISQITEKVVSDVSFWTAWIAFGGVVIGALIAIIGNVIVFNLQRKDKKKLDYLRKALLKSMLDDPNFAEGRSLETLCKVTGAEKEDCRRLLIEMKARGFTLAGGREGWTYIKNRPLNEQ